MKIDNSNNSIPEIHAAADELAMGICLCQQQKATSFTLNQNRSPTRPARAPGTRQRPGLSLVLDAGYRDVGTGNLGGKDCPDTATQLQHTQQEQQCRAHTQLSAGVRSTTRLQSTRHCFYCLCLLLLVLVLASHSSPLSQYPPCKETVTETVLKLGLFLQRVEAGVADLVPGPAVSRSLMTPSWSSPSPAASHVTRDTRPGNVP